MSRFAEFTGFFLRFLLPEVFLLALHYFTVRTINQHILYIDICMGYIHTHTVNTLDGSEFKSNYPTLHFAGGFAQRNML